MSQCQVLIVCLWSFGSYFNLIDVLFCVSNAFYFAHFPSVSLFISLWFVFTLVPLSSVSLVVIGSNHG